MWFLILGEIFISIVGSDEVDSKLFEMTQCDPTRDILRASLYSSLSDLFLWFGKWGGGGGKREGNLVLL